MDPVVWGSLQHHVSLLENVYLRLPLREQLQLRGVCKEWDAIASQRRCNTDVIRKPFFVVAVQDESESFGRYTVVGILTLHVASGCWRWTRLSAPAYALEPMSVPFSVEGIVFTTWGEIFPCFVDAYQHPPQHHGISRASPNFPGKASGMAVRAPHSFQFILGHPRAVTKIYDSATWLWERRLSRMPHVEREPTACKACLHFGDEVFIWSQVDTIFVYSLKEDVWSVLETPPSPEPGAGGALGVWDGQVFLFSCLSVCPCGSSSIVPSPLGEGLHTSQWISMRGWCRPAFKTVITKSESMPAFPRSLCSFIHWYVKVVLLRE
jgi:hypothetical protein